MENFRGSKSFYKKYQNYIKFTPKSVNSQSQVILAAGDFNRYIELSNHKELIKISEKYGPDNCLCESRQNCSLVNLFFDYDCKDSLITLPDAQNAIDALKTKIQAIFPQLIIKFFVKESVQDDNEDLINSMHFICHLSTPDGHNIYFDYSNGCSQVKFFVSKLDLKPPYDHKQAYSGHLLRLLYANKFDKFGKTCNRIFDISSLSDLDDPLKSLSSYCPTDKYMLLSDYLNQNFMIQYVKNQGYAKDYLFEHIKQRENESHLSLTLTEQHTPVCEHRSNNAVCMLYNQTDNPNIIIKCQDEECGKFFQTFFRYDDNRHRCQIFTTGDNSSERPSSSGSKSSQQSSNSVTPTKNSSSDDSIQKNAQTIVLNISKEANQDSGYTIDNVDHIEQTGYSAEGSPPANGLFRAIVNNQKCSFVGKDNYHHYTINGTEYKFKFSKDLIKYFKSLPRRYERQELLDMGIVFNQYNFFVNNTINIINNNNTNKEEVIYDDAFKDIEFKSEKHMEYFVNIFNNEIQFIAKLYNLDFPNEFLYVYDDKDSGQVMFFDNFDEETQTESNGGFWNMQGGFQIAKQKIRDYIVQFFNNVISQLDPKDKKKKLIQFRLNNIRNDIYNNNRFDQYLMETYTNRKIKFDNHPHFLHFQNGTFDLDQKQFIKTTPNMYNTFQIDYDYDPTVKYDDIYEQLSQIMQKNEFEWFLKQLSNCLNPNKVIEEKQFVVLVGFGDNGKTILCKLMTHALGTKAYAYNGRHHMVQTQNNSSSNATPDFAKLLNKRFCYIAELDKKVPFNQQQVKILTGGEEIQARDLYKSLITFQPCAGMFISCNQIPYIDTSDGGFLNRLKIIDLKYSFVENPTNKFQKPANKKLQSLIKSTQWKQGFMNIMIQYYYKKQIKIPKSILTSIQSRISLQQNPITQWVEENLQYEENKYVMADDIWKQYLENASTKIGKISFNRQVNDFFLQHPKDYNGIVYDLIDICKKNEKVKGKGFYNCSYKQREQLLD